MTCFPGWLRFVLLLVLCCAPLGACGDDGDELWIYTSIYPAVIERMQPALEEAFPGVAFRWYQKGSEQIAARLNMELDAGASPCDLLMTSDPFYYAELADAGLLEAYESPAAADVPGNLKDPRHAFATVRVPLMVIAVNHDRLDASAFPQSFRDLTAPRFRSRVAMGDPLKSGTTFTTVAALVRKYGWAYFEALRKNDVLSAGGNSSVLSKLETGERPVGIILLENLLPSLSKGAPITVIYPSDGAIPVPSPVGILKGTDRPALARRIYDYLFSEVMQEAIVSGHMYSPLPAFRPPEGARAWKDLALFPWDAAFLTWVKKERVAIKKRFRSIMRG